MLSSFWCSICFSVLVLSGVTSSTLHLHPDQRYTLPQNRGFFTVGANEDLFAGDGRSSAASALPLAARSDAQVMSGSGAHREHRSRRSAGKSAMPKVYGQDDTAVEQENSTKEWVQRSISEYTSTAPKCRRTERISSLKINELIWGTAICTGS
ncbi:hypothetical protein CHARACLAT_017934 [Characodon lateralis]|uniref:Uncharacterized protein n=1 Tax=Characodon lateralis TaxID=208331 RepID=A0ABU7ENK0_9TELE|nr:hypothetical protein [Characodon lateralis]